ncbi:MAG: recombinase family protein [Opitutaceae bacterium]|nr:recombinase family protein [Opitutaceae bacterium]
MNAESKVTSEHLKRAAYLYVRQSSLHQVLENTESTERQYALRRRAIALGWSDEQVVVIDHDQGQSGASAADREGFQRLVAEVGLGKAGIVMGLEVSRLARNCADWHRLLEICALSSTLILDEDGLYEPSHYNDRLLLGLKGTMSEAELHVLRARLVGGVLNKAQRGELKIPLPVGLIYTEEDRVELDPDQQVQQSLRMLFATFERTGAAWATVQSFHREGLKFPRRAQAGSGEIVWRELGYQIALATLHNPRYAGAFCFGRSRVSKTADGRVHIRHLPRDQWRFIRKEAHPGYITWETFLANQQRLLVNLRGNGAEQRSGPAREGPALLQGLVVCGKCGRSMTLHYHDRQTRKIPEYLCQRPGIEKGEPACQRIHGEAIDAEVGRLLIECVTPLALEVVLHVQSEIENRLAEAERLRLQHLQRLQYDAEQARVRYMRVDPNNRLVADTLETQWNEKLRLLVQAKEAAEQQRDVDAVQITDEQKGKIRALAADFPKLWRDPKTLDRDRKRMARLLLEDVTLRREQEFIVQVRFKGGATRELRVPLPQRSWERWTTEPEIISEIDRLLEQHSDSEIARILNERGLSTGCGNRFDSFNVSALRRTHHLKSRRQRLGEQGWMTSSQVASLLGCSCTAVPHWHNVGLLQVISLNNRGDFLYRRPSDDIISQIRVRQQRHRRKARYLESKPTGAV